MDTDCPPAGGTDSSVTAEDTQRKQNKSKKTGCGKERSYVARPCSGPGLGRRDREGGRCVDRRAGGQTDGGPCASMPPKPLTPQSLHPGTRHSEGLALIQGPRTGAKGRAAGWEH